MDEIKSWLVVCVQSNREKKTYERLKALGYDSFLPLQEETHRWSDRSKKVQRVVIPMVVFVRISPSERIPVLRLPSVSRFMVLRGESTPAIIPDAQMERFRFMLDYSEEAVEMCVRIAVESLSEQNLKSYSKWVSEHSFRNDND